MKRWNLGLIRRLVLIAGGSLFATGTTCAPTTTVSQDPNQTSTTNTAVEQVITSGLESYLTAQVLYFLQNPQACTQSGGSGLLSGL